MAKQGERSRLEKVKEVLSRVELIFDLEFVPI